MWLKLPCCVFVGGVVGGFFDGGEGVSGGWMSRQLLCGGVVSGIDCFVNGSLRL